VAIASAGALRFGAAARARGSLVPAAVVAIGLALLALPFATAMWERAPKGERMMAAFTPYMKAERIARYERDVALLDKGVRAARRYRHGRQQLTAFTESWPAVHKRFRSLLDPIAANRANFEAVEALPSFRSFPWFFVAPGLLLIGLGAAALVRPRAWLTTRWAIAAVALGLVLAPVAFGMFERAPKGARMIDAFQTVETHRLVTAVQNDFGTIAIGQGSLRTELPARIAKRLPAVRELNRDWTGILQRFTPLLGVMSDNVANYRATAALPSFSLFPWFFLIPGLVLGLLATRQRSINETQDDREPDRARGTASADDDRRRNEEGAQGDADPDSRQEGEEREREVHGDVLPDDPSGREGQVLREPRFPRRRQDVHPAAPRD
jgi:hypothetical protein